MKISATGQALKIGGTPVSMPMPRITVSGDGLARGGVAFKSWGLQMQMIDIEHEFYAGGGTEYRETMDVFLSGIRRMGANTTRIHMNLWDFIEGTDENTLTIKSASVANLLYFLSAARKNQIYVLMCGANTWLPDDVPSWYDALDYAVRWDVQSFYWSEIASAVFSAGHSTTVLGYDLINEPYISADPDADWYGHLLGPYAFTSLIARGPLVDNNTIRDWITQIKSAITTNDPQALVTFGSLPYFSSGVGYANTEGLLDFLSPHLYTAFPALGLTHAQSMIDVIGWTGASVPLVIGETAMWATQEECDEFMAVVIDSYAGIIAPSYGYPPDQFTTPPEPPKPPAPADGDPAFYEIFGESLGVFNGYRTEFLGP